MKTKSIFVIIISLLSVSLFAEKITVASCKMGNGCSFHLTNLTTEEIDEVFGTEGVYSNMPKKSILVMANIHGEIRNYVETKMNRSQLDKYYGGDGFTQISLFLPGFQPKSGTWAVEFGQVKETGCEYINRFQKKNHFVSVLQGMKAQRDLKFSNPFDPSVLMPSSMITWKKGLNNYVGTLGNDFMKMIYVVNLKSDILIEGYYRVITIVPTEGGYCENYIPVTMKCIKADPEKEEWDDWEEQEVIDPFESGPNEEIELDIPDLDDDEP